MALFKAVLAASNEANAAAATGAKPKTYKIKLSCGVTYAMSNGTSDLYVEMFNSTGHHIVIEGPAKCPKGKTKPTIAAEFVKEDYILMDFFLFNGTVKLRRAVGRTHRACRSSARRCIRARARALPLRTCDQPFASSTGLLRPPRRMPLARQQLCPRRKVIGWRGWAL